MSKPKFIPILDEGTYVYWASKVPQAIPELNEVNFIKSRMVVGGTKPEVISKMLYLTQNN